MDEQSSLLTLFASSFLAATLLPGGSEAVLVGVLLKYPELHWQALILATVGNTLGGMSSYWIGRFLPDEKTLLTKSAGHSRGLEWVRRHGAINRGRAVRCCWMVTHLLVVGSAIYRCG